METFLFFVSGSSFLCMLSLFSIIRGRHVCPCPEASNRIFYIFFYLLFHNLKYSSRASMSSRAQRVDDILAAEESLITRQDRHLQAAEKSWLRKCLILLRPFEIIIGIVCFVMALLVFLSLLLTK